MKWTVAAVVVILLISTLPLVQSQTTEQQIQEQIQEPREQSPAGACSQVLMVVGSNVLFVLSALYTTLLGLLDFVWATCYTSICAPILGILGGLGGSVVGILAAIGSAIYTSICAPVMAFVAFVLNAAYTTVCAPSMGILGGICGSVLGILAAFVTFVVDALYTSCFGAVDLVCASCVGVFNALYTSICAIPIGLVGGIIGSCVGGIAAVLNACYTTIFGVVDLACASCVGGIGLVAGVIGGVCGSILGICGSILGAIGSILGVVDFVWACIAGFDFFNIPIWQALSYISALFFWAGSTFFGLCSISGIPCCNLCWCCIPPIGFAVSTIGGIFTSCSLETIYFIWRVISMLPFF